MISKMQFMNSVLGKPVVDAVVQTLYNQSNDFPAIYEAYLAAVKSRDMKTSQRMVGEALKEARYTVRAYQVQ